MESFECPSSNEKQNNLEMHAGKYLYSPKEVCAILKISIQSLRRSVKLGRIKVIYVGRFLRIPVEEVEKLVGSQNTITVKEAAKLLNVGVIAVRNLIKNNVIKAVRLAEKGPWKIPICEIENFIKNNVQ